MAAFDTFVQKCDEFITQARAGEPFDKSTLPKEPMSPVWILISLAVGIAIAFIIVGIMKSKLKTVRFQPKAKDYIKEGSMNITESHDMFLYRTVDKKEKPKSNSGSSTHTSSSGRTHGGGGGGF